VVTGGSEAEKPEWELFSGKVKSSFVLNIAANHFSGGGTPISTSSAKLSFTPRAANDSFPPLLQICGASTGPKGLEKSTP
jgi:hypothetical protein